MLVALAEGQRLEPAIGQFQPDFWMTSYEAAIFLDDDRVDALRNTKPQRLEDVA